MNLLLSRNPIYPEHLAQESQSWVAAYSDHEDGTHMEFSYYHPRGFFNEELRPIHGVLRVTLKNGYKFTCLYA